MKFGFVFETEWAVDEKFVSTCETENVLEKVIGVESATMGKKAVEILAKDEIKTFDFCGAFLPEHLDALKEEYGKEYTFNLMKYLPEEEAKLEQAESLAHYGVIIKNGEINSLQKEELVCPTCETTIYFVKDMEMAKEAARELIDAEIDFIELCSFFDKEKLEEIIEEIDGKVPVGTAGQI